MRKSTNRRSACPPKRSGKQLTVLAQVDGLDLLREGPDGSLFPGGTTGDVRQIRSDGKLSTFAGGSCRSEVSRTAR
jgi:hypothetical protein